MCYCWILKKTTHKNLSPELVNLCYYILVIVTYCNFNIKYTMSYMPTLPDYPGVSRIRHQSPSLPYGSPYLPDKIIFCPFMCVSLRCSPFLSQNWIFRIGSTVSGAFLHLYLVIDKDYFWHQNANFDSMYFM